MSNPTVPAPDSIQRDPTTYAGMQMICHNCGRLGTTHVPFAPFNCKAYEDEHILETMFEAWVVIANKPPFWKSNV